MSETIIVITIAAITITTLLLGPLYKQWINNVSRRIKQNSELESLTHSATVNKITLQNIAADEEASRITTAEQHTRVPKGTSPVPT